MVNVYEAKTRLSQLIDTAASGSDVIIARNGKPVARLTAIEPAPKPQTREECLKGLGFGALEGKGWIADDFDAPLPEDFLVRPDGE